MKKAIISCGRMGSPWFVLLCFTACYLENGVMSFEPSLNAQVMDSQKTCQVDAQCKIINQSCCGEKEGFIAVNKFSSRSILRGITEDCAKKRGSNADLCKDKKRATTRPKVVCTSGSCSIKSEAPAGDEAECDADYQCEAFDPDCCNSGKNFVAINFSFGGKKRHDKAQDCNKKLADNPGLCGSVKRRWSFIAQPVVKCVEKKCTIKSEK